MADSKVVRSSDRPKPPNAGKGRVKGVPNKTTALLKDAILLAAEKAGNKLGDDGLVTYLEVQAEDNPVAFMSLLGKVLPMQMIGAGDKGEHIVAIEWRRAN
jgi:hypothetical protein